MHHHALADDLRSLLERGVAGSARYESLEQACLAAHGQQELCSVLAAVRLGSFSALALLLKQDWEAHDADRGPWQPWTRLNYWSQALASFSGFPEGERLHVLLLEQWGLGCQHLPLRMLSALEERERQSAALLERAEPQTQVAFLADKKLWLQREFELFQLSDLHAQSVQDIERTRIAYLQMYREPHECLLRAAHALAVWRYREHFDDISLTAAEVSERLASDLQADTGSPLLEFEPGLCAVLCERVEELHNDLSSLQRVRELAAAGLLNEADPEDLACAAALYRKLARRIHPDALCHHPQVASISAENRRRLHEIWCAATAMHRRRAYLERRRLVDFTRNLEGWDREVTQILRHLEFHDPSRIVAGDTLDEQWEYVRASLEEVTHHLHALRDDVAQLAADLVYRQQRELVAMSDLHQQRECDRMRGQAALWQREAKEIEQRMLSRSAVQAQAERAMRREAPP